MLDMKFLCENPEIVEENIKKRFQDHKVELVDKMTATDKENRFLRQRGDELRSKRNAMSKEIGGLMVKGLKDEANAIKAKVQATVDEMREIEVKEAELAEKIEETMMQILNIIHPTVSVGKDDLESVELQKYGELAIPDPEILYHIDITERFEGIGLDSARKAAGNGLYCLMGDITRFHSTVTSYARGLMTDRGFIYIVLPFMIRSNVVTGAMSSAEMEGMMYKIEGEDLYLIGTSEHSMIGKPIDTILDEKKLPYIYTGYSPCFHKEKGAHGTEEREVYRIH